MPLVPWFASLTCRFLGNFLFADKNEAAGAAVAAVVAVKLVLWLG